MKVLYTIISLLLISWSIQAQDFEDAWRYSQNDPIGTARYAGMGGAFSSLGGDLSAVSLNPAGASTFTTNRISGTMSFYNNSNTADYFGTLTHSDYRSFDNHFLDFDQLGAVLVFKSNKSDWGKLALSVNYNKNTDYGNYLRIKGTNTAGHSLTDYFVANANGIRLSDIELIDGYTQDYQWLGENIGYDAQQAYLGYQAYVINAVDDTDPDNTQYVPNAIYNNVNHMNRISSIGDKSHWDFTLAGTYQKTLQLGLSFTTYSIDYTEKNTIEEDNYNAASDLQYLKFNNTLRVEGTGYAVKLGAIYKIAPGTKLSLAYHSPQWLEINEFTTQAIHTEMGNGDQFDISPDVENQFAPYKIITPSKFIIGASKVFDKKFVLSADYTYQNMAKLHFKEIDVNADDSYFENINDGIANNMQAVHQFNIGGELKLSELFLRAGAFSASSPLKNNTNLFTSTGYAFGGGYDFGSFTLDVTYSHMEKQSEKTVFGLPDTALISNNQNKILIGARFNF